jgi:hypothetical protein
VEKFTHRRAVFSVILLERNIIFSLSEALKKSNCTFEGDDKYCGVRLSMTFSEWLIGNTINQKSPWCFIGHENVNREKSPGGLSSIKPNKDYFSSYTTTALLDK